jgi:phosphoglycolate phosphatase-like HAD superfamily hydrolase
MDATRQIRDFKRTRDFKLILWDIDGTLMHCGSDGRLALNRTFRERYGIEDAFDAAPIGGAMDSIVLRNILDTYQIKHDDLDAVIDHYSDVLAEILAANSHKRVLPGIRSILEAVDRHPQRVNALLTSNLKIGARTKLRSVGLDGFFELGGFGDRPGEKWDAAKLCIEEAETRYKNRFAPNDIILIGDSCYDVICAKELGVCSIAVATGWADAADLMRCDPDHFFSDLGDTKRVLDILGIKTE